MSSRSKTRSIIVSFTLAEAEALHEIAKNGLWPRHIKRALDKISKSLAFIQLQPALPKREVKGSFDLSREDDNFP